MSIKVSYDVAGAMRDGTLLRADVYRPEGEGPFPVLLRRTPYAKESWAHLAEALADRGYLVVVQDIRGRHASDGQWVWAFAAAAQRIEAEDGYDSVEWAAALPDANGTVGVWGHSYDAWAAWRLAGEQPPSLRGIVAAGITVGLLDVTRGILDLGRRLEWCYLEAADARRRAGRTDGPLTAEDAHTDWVGMERGKWLWFHPLADVPEQVFAGITRMLADYYDEIDRELWAFDEIHPRVQVPTCVVTGWWDRFVRGVDHFTLMREHGPEETRDQHRLVVGPWSHDPDGFGERYDVLGSGPDTARSFVDIVTGFFDPLLRGAPASDAPPASVYTLGLERWQSFATWPPADTSTERLHLRAEGGLTWEAPGEEQPDRYTFDPRDPVMSLMGADAQLAPLDQRGNDHRPDKLVYQTGPLLQPVEVAGLVRVVLWAGTDAPDTDWVARLVRVDEHGVAVNLAEGILRARYRHGYGAEVPLTDDSPQRYLVELSPVSVLFRPGERIRVDVTSSDFPNFDRNHNTGRAFAHDAELRPAHQAIHHDAEHPSAVLLPVRRVSPRG
ncbi:MAG: CocE/NonD family hydrolase [Nocardioidaceae bacterium]|nr:CocE/NonD family hydrolase [Nocardioidaceae bacterium]